MPKLGYIYRPISLPPSDAERQQLLNAGAEQVWVDLGDRQYYTRAIEYFSGTAEDSALLLLSVAELGDTVTQVAQQLQAWSDRAVEVWVVDKNGVQTSRDATAVETWLAGLPLQLKSRQISAGHALSRLQRKPPPGPAPFGYCRQGDVYQLEGDRAAIVRTFFDNFLLFGSIRGAVKSLQVERGETVSISTARRWLTSAVYRGDLTFKDGVTLRDTHPALLSREEAAQIDRWMRRNRQISRRSASAPRALAGLAICQTCQQPLRIVQATQKQRQKVYRYLRCDRCRYSHDYDRVLQATVKIVCQQLPAKTANFSQTPVAELKKCIDLQLKANESILNSFDSKNSAIAPLDLRDQLQRYRLEGENAALNQTLEQLPPENLAAIAQTLSIESFWLDLTEPEQRSYLREFIRQIGIDADMNLDIQFFF
ncbi:recombinase family protein [Synechococcus sp. PCC 7336]|uniref:recombinase family protein n=1 Tax=Synechococcus sp. PCC 7336 TaxID=195250 RepID=UPI00034748D2|nr:recombinase family protein [Synechococcus sp. PCC 7336]